MDGIELPDQPGEQLLLKNDYMIPCISMYGYVALPCPENGKTIHF
jgi:hypothetical protein